MMLEESPGGPYRFRGQKEKTFKGKTESSTKAFCGLLDI